MKAIFATHTGLMMHPIFMMLIQNMAIICSGSMIFTREMIITRERMSFPLA